ncbi:MAG: endonuclease [Thermovirgaceae bacterium]
MYAGIDPGREKFGWALVEREGKLVLSGIAPRQSFGLWLEALAAGKAKNFGHWVYEGAAKDPTLPPCRNILLGEGTGMKEMAEKLRAQGIAFETVPEAYSTLRARKLYWMLHPPRGLVRLVPLSFRVPPRPVDDLAAWRLVLDYLGFSDEKVPYPSGRS